MSSTISILAITKSTGGTAFYNSTLLTGLRKLGFRSHTLCLSENAETYAEALQSDGLSAQVIWMDRYRINIGGDLAVFRKIVSAARRSDIDVIVCHGSKAGFLGRAAGWLSGKPVVYCQASLPFLPRIQGRKSIAYGALELLARTFGGHVVSLTAGARDISRRYGIVGKDDISVIRTGIDLDHFRTSGQRDEILAEMGLDPTRPVVGWIGRFEPQKAPLDYIDALKIVAPQHPDVQFVIVGEGRQQGEVEERIRDSGLEQSVRLFGWQQNPVRTYEAFDILAMSSRWEGLPLTLLEAMALETVPVSTDVDGCAEVVRDGTDGLLVPSSEPQAMAEALGNLLQRDDLATMKRQARTRIETAFDEKRMLSEWDTLLRSVCKNAKPVTSA